MTDTTPINTSEHDSITPPKKPAAAKPPKESLDQPPADMDPSLMKRLTNLTGDVTVGALKLAVKAGGMPVRLGRSFITDGDKLNMMLEGGLPTRRA
ncbi:MAG: hypothetical protein IPM39_21815 [Chloroflexi bacterium]|nr:hypothetical protein [Chloroflexota bacterium]